MKSPNQNAGRSFENETADEVQTKNVNHVITKFVGKGFDKLTLEELAVTLITPDFADRFKKATGSVWNPKMQVKVIDRLTKANFDIKWMTRKSDGVHNALFASCARGDVDKVLEYLRKSDDSAIDAVDSTMKTGLHIAVKEGHIALSEVLIQKRFNVNCRDRTLKTPLHYACLNSHETLTEILLKSGADILARDSSGRTALHFAACGNSVKAITALIATKPEIVNLVDNVGRSPLHYAVWNSSQKQVDIMRTLLENEADPNLQDEDGKTPLHHAAEGARSRAIPILLQKGAKIGIREHTNNKLPLDLAVNDRIRELIIVYSASPYNVKQSDIDFMDTAIRGQPVPTVKPGDLRKKPEDDVSPIKVALSKNREKMIIPNFIRDKLFDIMRKIQDHGVQSYQHIKRPYMFTGSWLEDINKLEDFHTKIASLTATEATLRIFNVLFPYEKEFPESTTEKPLIDNFYGEYWNFEADVDKNLNADVAEFGKMREDEVRKYETLVEISKKQLEEAKADLETLKAHIENQNKQIATLKDQVSRGAGFEKERADFASQLKKKTDEIAALNQELKSLRPLQRELEEKNLEIELLKSEIPQGTSPELEEALQKIADLEGQLAIQKEKDRAMRYRAGRVFIKTLEDNGFVRQGGSADDVDQNFLDDQAILRMCKALDGNPPGIEIRLRQADSDGDGRLNRTEFIKCFEKLKLSPQDINSLLRVAGFFEGKVTVGIDEFANVLRERPKLRNMWEEGLFKRLLTAFKKNNWEIDQAFKFMDADNSGELSKAEFKKGLDSIDVKLSAKDCNALFIVLDENRSGTIDLTELKSRLLTIAPVSDHKTEKETKKEGENKRGGANGDDIEKVGRVKVSNALLGSMFIKPLIEDTEMNGSYRLINGELKLQIPNAKGLKIPKTNNELFLKIKLPGATLPKVTKTVPYQGPSDGVEQWNLAFKFPLLDVLLENVHDNVTCQIFTHLDIENEDTFMGEVVVPWKHCLSVDEQWLVNKEFPIESTSFPQTQNPIGGTIHIQCKWIPATSSAFRSQKTEPKTIPKTFECPGTFDGYLEVLLMAALNVGYKERISCKLALPNKSQETFEAKFQDGQPFWNKQHVIDMKKLNPKAQLNNIECTLYYQESGMFGKKIELGTVLLDWSECLQFPNQYNAIKAYPNFNNPMNKNQDEDICKIYAKTRWIPRDKYKQMQAEVKKGTQPENFEEGILKVNIVRAKKLLAADTNIFSKNSSDPLAKLRFAGVEVVEKETSKISSTLNPNWKSSFEFPVKFYKESFLPPLEIKVYDWDMVRNDLLGTLNLDWSAARKRPCQWVIDEYIPLENPDPKKYQNQNYFGEIYVQVYYVPKGTFDPNTQPIDKDVGEVLNAKDTKLCKGTLVVRVVHGKDLRPADGTTSDPYFTVQFPDGNVVSGEKINKTLTPIWNQRVERKLNMKMEEAVTKKLFIEVKDSDWGSDDLLGYCYVDWVKALDAPGTWAVNDIIPLEGDDIKRQHRLKSLGEIYVQAKFLSEGMIDDGKLPEAKQDLKKMAEEATITGTMLINVVHAVGLRKADSGLFGGLSDPLVKITFPDQKTLPVPYIKNTLNPKWNYSGTMQIKLPQAAYAPLRVEVYDHNTLQKNVLLGFIDLDWKSCAEEGAGEWAINDAFELNGPEDVKRKQNIESFGQIYLQVKFLKQGMQDDGVKPPVKQNIEEYIKQEAELKKQLIIGKLYLNIIHARGLVRADDGATGKADPFVTVYLPNKKTVKSDYKEKTLNPIWNFKQEVSLNIPRSELKPIKVEIWDHDSIFDANDLQGYIQIPWKQCVENAGTWAINEEIAVIPPEKTNFAPDEPDLGWGKVYVQAKFVKEGDVDDGKEPELKVNLEEILKVEGVLVTGTLHVGVIHCKGLPQMDTGLQGSSIDPFCRISIPPKTSFNTPILKNNKNPVWKFRKAIPISMPRNEIRPMTFEVLDHDTANSDDLVGTLKVPWLECVDHSGTWHINNIYPINELPDARKLEPFDPNETEPKKSELYIQVKFVKTGDPEGPSEPELLEDLEAILKKQVEVVTGTLKINVPHCKNLFKDDGKTVDPYIKIKINGKEVVKTKYQSKTLNPLFDLHHDYSLSLAKNVWDHDSFTFNDQIGYLELSLMDCINNPGAWVFNDNFDIQRPSNLSAKKGTEGFGQMYIQMGFFTQEKPYVENSEPPVKDNLAEIIAKQKEKIVGTLQVRVIHGKDLLARDNNGFSDPYVIVHAPGAKNQQCPKIDKNLNPIWKFMPKFNINLPKDQLTPLKIEVWDDDLGFDDLIGTREINIQECLDNPGVWCINNKYKLIGSKDLEAKLGPGSFGEIYVQVRFLKEGMLDDNKEPELLENLEAVLAEQNALIKGTLKLNLNHAKNLISKDGKPGNPYCTITVPNNKLAKTQIIKNTINPIFESKRTFPISLTKREATEKGKYMINFELKDDKFFGDTLLGYYSIDLVDVIDKKGIWGLDGYYPLNGPENLKKAGTYSTFGEIYLQMMFVPEGQDAESVPFPPLKENLKEILEKERAPEIGTFHIRVIHAKGLPVMDSGIEGNSCDPYIEIHLPNGKILKTDVKKNTLRAIWKQAFTEKISVPKNELKPLIFKVKDKDQLNADDDIGSVEIHAMDCIGNPCDWAINQVYQIQGTQELKKKLKTDTLGELYVQVKYVPDGANDTSSPEPKLIEDLQAQIDKENEIIKGQLKVKLIHGKKLLPLDGSASDPFVRIIATGCKEEDGPVLKKTVNPKWNNLISLPCTFKNNELAKANIKLEVLNKNAFTSDSMLGFTNVPFAPLIENGQWLNQIFKLEGLEKFKEKATLNGGYGELYAMIRFAREGSADLPEPTLLENIDEYIKKQSEPLKGTLRVIAVKGKSLIARDDEITSDPYIKFTFPGGKTAASEKVNKNLNPEWNFSHDQPLNISREKYVPIKVEVFDKDLLKSDDMGEAFVDWQSCIEKPGEWAINDFIPLQGNDNLNKMGKFQNGYGFVYLQIKWLPDQMKDPSPTPPPVKP